MPKQKITKEMVVDAAFGLARSGGMEQVTVKSIAQKLHCSVQPIYSYCKNMDGLRRDVIERVRDFVREYVNGEISPKNPFRTTGQAYVRLAKEEPHIFRIFILHQRDGISSLEELYREETNPHIAEALAGELQISLSRAKQLHLHMLIYTIGVGTIFSVTTPGIPAEEIYEQQEAAYKAFLNQALGSRPSEAAEGKEHEQQDRCGL